VGDDVTSETVPSSSESLKRGIDFAVGGRITSQVSLGGRPPLLTLNFQGTRTAGIHWNDASTF